MRYEGLETRLRTRVNAPSADEQDVFDVSEDVVVFLFAEDPLFLGVAGVQTGVGHVVVDEHFHGCQVFLFRRHHLKYRLRKWRREGEYNNYNASHNREKSKANEFWEELLSAGFLPEKHKSISYSVVAILEADSQNVVWMFLQANRAYQID